MTPRCNRRRFVAGAAALPFLKVLGLPLVPGAAAQGVELGAGQPFSFALLRERAKALASARYQPRAERVPELLETIDYDAYQKIKFVPARGLWADGSAPFAVQLFHLGRYFKAPVKINVVSDGTAREVLYSPAYFSYGDPEVASELPEDLGFAGFRLMEAERGKTDWLVFLGASYFRSSGALDQYGMSARGIAINTGMSTPEEFPAFTEFWLAPGPPDSNRMTIYALLDGPSLTGAYRFDATKDVSAVMDVRAELFPRKDIERMGVAPLTSMFWFAEHNRHQATDWRPEVHDSDGLALWTGAGERLWRPLNNPPSVQVNSFLDKDPKGFGLLQRDRAFHNYQDDGVFYDRRPSVWVEPLGAWGEGAVQLVEIPTDDEIYDNIVAYWVPAEPVKARSDWAFRYRLQWVAEEPYPSVAVGRVIATRLGRGGVPGQPRPEGKVKFVIDFAGGPLAEMEKQDDVKPVITASRGRVDNDYALQVVGTKNWRAFFDLTVDGGAPVDLRCFLRLGDRTLTETWLYQHFPFQFEAS